ncbi:hypothetical protein MCEREM21A_00011 [Sphingomonadaceae bacterium]
MSHLSKLTIKRVLRQDTLDPVQARRNKLLFALEEQLSVADAVMQGKQYSVTVPRWSNNEQGERVRIEHQRIPRAWFFAQDNGFYVQCKYGSKPLPLSKDGNAVFVKQITEVPSVLQAFYAAASAGEFDAAIGTVAQRRASVK